MEIDGIEAIPASTACTAVAATVRLNSATPCGIAWNPERRTVNGYREEIHRAASDSKRNVCFFRL